MTKSLILQLPDIVAHGHQRASHFLAGLEDRQQIAWRSRQLALSALGEAPHAGNHTGNHLVCGNDLGVLAALLSGHNKLPYLSGRVKLICFDPCLSDPLACASATELAEMERLAALTMRLLLMRKLLADTGFIWVRLTHEPTPCARLVLDTVFGSENNAQDILWHTPPTQRMASAALRHGLVHLYSKHRRRMEPVLPDSTAHRQQSSCAAEAMLRHLLAVTTAPGDTVVSLNAAAEIATVASTSPRQWIIATPDPAAGDALRQHFAAGGRWSFLRHTQPAPCSHQQAQLAPP